LTRFGKPKKIIYIYRYDWEKKVSTDAHKTFDGKLYMNEGSR